MPSRPSPVTFSPTSAKITPNRCPMFMNFPRLGQSLPVRCRSATNERNGAAKGLDVRAGTMDQHLNHLLAPLLCGGLPRERERAPCGCSRAPYFCGHLICGSPYRRPPADLPGLRARQTLAPVRSVADLAIERVGLVTRLPPRMAQKGSGTVRRSPAGHRRPLHAEYHEPFHRRNRSAAACSKAGPPPRFSTRSG